MFNNIEEVLNYIESKTNFQLGLLRVQEFLKEAQIDFNSLKFIHIGGTNGKGSVSYYLSNILIKQGYKTGFFASPSLQGHNDRIRINDVFIRNEEIVAFVNEYYDLIEKTEVTMFEIDVLMALDYFVKHQVEYVVMEVGMGGRYDGTNVIQPLVSVITNIGMDHQAYLGDTKAKIALNKAGIIKENTPIITAERDKEALNVIKAEANKMHAPFVEVEKAEVVSEVPLIFSYKDYENVVMKTLAKYQVINASTVIDTVKVLNDLGIEIAQENVYEVFKTITWPGRFEVISQKPFVIIDGAHNLEGVNALANSLRVFDDYHKTIIFTALGDKDTQNMQDVLASISDKLIITTFDFYRAVSTDVLDPENKYEHADDYERLIDNKISTMTDKDILVITGSLYFISRVRDYLLNKFNN